MKSLSMNNLSILAGAVLVTLAAIVAQVMLAAPGVDLSMLG